MSIVVHVRYMTTMSHQFQCHIVINYCSINDSFQFPHQIVSHEDIDDTVIKTSNAENSGSDEFGFWSSSDDMTSSSSDIISETYEHNDDDESLPSPHHQHRHCRFGIVADDAFARGRTSSSKPIDIDTKKSTMMIPHAHLQTGDVPAKCVRGKNTTIPSPMMKHSSSSLRQHRLVAGNNAKSSSKLRQPSRSIWSPSASDEELASTHILFMVLEYHPLGSLAQFIIADELSDKQGKDKGKGKDDDDDESPLSPSPSPPPSPSPSPSPSPRGNSMKIVANKRVHNALYIALQLLESVKFMHSEGWMHRDL